MDCKICFGEEQWEEEEEEPLTLILLLMLSFIVVIVVVVIDGLPRCTGTTIPTYLRSLWNSNKKESSPSSY
jgi:hypothetical protein